MGNTHRGQSEMGGVYRMQDAKRHCACFAHIVCIVMLYSRIAAGFASKVVPIRASPDSFIMLSISTASMNFTLWPIGWPERKYFGRPTRFSGHLLFTSLHIFSPARARCLDCGDSLQSVG